MKQYWTGLSIRKRLFISLPLLLAALFLLWAALGWPLSVRYTLQMVERESGLPSGEVVAEGVLSLGDRPQVGRFYWAVSRCGDRFTAVSARRFYTSVAWGGSRDLYCQSFMQPTEDDPLKFCYLVQGMQGTYLEQPTDSGAFGSTVAYNMDAVAVCSIDPEIVRVEVTMCRVPNLWLGEWEAFLSEKGVVVECTEASPGSGVWVGQGAVPIVSASGGSGYFTLVRGYGADGTLRCETMNKYLI